MDVESLPPHSTIGRYTFGFGFGNMDSMSSSTNYVTKYKGMDGPWKDGMFIRIGSGYIEGRDLYNDNLTTTVPFPPLYTMDNIASYYYAPSVQMAVVSGMYSFDNGIKNKRLMVWLVDLKRKQRNYSSLEGCL